MTGTGKSHLAIAIARGCIRRGARSRFFNVVDLVNRLESEARGGRQESQVELRKLIEKVVIYPTPPFKPYEVEIKGILVAINSKAPECGSLHRRKANQTAQILVCSWPHLPIEASS